LQQTIYVDILLTVNFIIDYFLLRLTGLLTGQHPSGKRLVCTALLATLTSLMIFVPSLPQWVNVAVNLLFSTILSLICFGYGDIYGFLLRSAAFYGINLLYAGGILLLCFTCKPDNVLFYHGVLYFPMSPVGLISASAVLYFGVKLFRLSLKNGRIIEKSITVFLTYGGSTIALKGYTDTGNHAYDLYSGKPVVFCTASALTPIIGADGVQWFQTRQWLSQTASPSGLCIRLLPLRFAGGDGVLPIFLPERLETETASGKRTLFDATVAIVPQPFREGYDILLHPELTATKPSAERQGIT